MSKLVTTLNSDQDKIVTNYIKAKKKELQRNYTKEEFSRVAALEYIKNHPVDGKK